MPGYLGNGRAWPCTLQCSNMSSPVQCWVFRRINSRVPSGVIELLAPIPLVSTYQLKDGDSVVIRFDPRGA